MNIFTICMLETYSICLSLIMLFQKEKFNKCNFICAIKLPRLR